MFVITVQRYGGDTEWHRLYYGLFKLSSENIFRVYFIMMMNSCNVEL